MYCSELFTNIKLLKIYAWEGIFAGKVLEERKKQVKLLLKGSCLSAVISE